MTSLVIASGSAHRDSIRKLFREYLEWGNGMLAREFKVSFDTAAMVEGDMATLSKFLPPRGCLLLAVVNGEIAGLACLKELTAEIGEVKRMYVRPAFRRRGLGRLLVERLLAEARNIGYDRVRLDSARFMTQAHQLYRAAGFREIKPYPGSEIPPEYQRHWIFMDKPLMSR